MKSQRMVEVGEAVLESVIYGAGDTVILLPGGGCSVSYFDPFAQTLAAAGFRTVAVNPRGVSASTGSLQGCTLHHLAADIAGVIEALADASVHVLGHAFGNRIARCLAATVQTWCAASSCWRQEVSLDLTRRHTHPSSVSCARTFPRPSGWS